MCGVAAANVVASEDQPCSMLGAGSPEACSPSCAEDAAHMRSRQRPRHTCALPSLHPCMHRSHARPGTCTRAAYGGVMALDLLMDRGTPIERQRFTWKELVQAPISKLDADASDEDDDRDDRARGRDEDDERGYLARDDDEDRDRL